MNLRKIIPVLLLVTALLGTLYVAQKLVSPKYMTKIIEGGLVEPYYSEQSKHDVIFLGDCEVYGNISPVYLYEQYGITSYVRGTPDQLMWHSYYMLEDTLRHETPKVVVLSVLALHNRKLGKEEYNRLTFDGMEWSMTKLSGIRDSKHEEESYLDYIFPVLRYHARWKELTEEDIQYMFHRKKTTHNGYYMRIDIKPATSVPKGKKLVNYSLGKRSMDYLNRIEKLCRDKNITLVLYKAPSLYPHWYDQWNDQVKEFAKRKGLLYINALAERREIGLDFMKDTYDMGLHLNLSGAEKLSEYLGRELKKNILLADRRKEKDRAAIWHKKGVFYRNMIKEQHKELEKYGYLKSFGARAPR